MDSMREMGHRIEEHTSQKTRVFIKQDGIHDTARWRERSNTHDIVIAIQTDHYDNSRKWSMRKQVYTI